MNSSAETLRHRLQFVRPSRAALAARAGAMRAVAIAFFVVALALLAAAAGLMPGPAALGWSLVALGIAHGGAVFATEGAQVRGLFGAIGAAYGVCGGLLLVEPEVGPLLLLAVVSVAFVVGGIAQATFAVVKPHAQSIPAVIAGVGIAVLGAAVAFAWPVAAVPALAVVFGLAAAAQGAACLRLALAGERLRQRNLFGLRKKPSTRQPSGARAMCRLPPGRQT